MPEGRRLLDVGCGTGPSPHRLAIANPAHAIGVDRSTHRMIGEPDSWDTGLDVRVRFEPLDRAARRLQLAGYREDEFVGCLVLD